MNGKRQTIWLVSMLSLMVVLSAYYLFTEDSGSTAPKETAGTIQVDSVKNAPDALPQVAAGDGAVATEVTDAADAGVTDGTAADPAADPAAVKDPATADSPAVQEEQTAGDTAAAGSSDKAAAKDAAAAGEQKAADPAADQTAKSDDASKSAADTTAKSGGKSDAEVLNQVASQNASASAMIESYMLEREQQNIKQHDDLMAIMNDMDKSPAESAAASEKLSKLEDREAVIESIESKLQKQFGEAVVKEDGGDAYKVVVLSDKLDAKQAAGIIDLVIKELNVTQDKISVQHVSEQ
ncbi:SpoIIIAH-like family protein [Paenibacillus glufosinatiresistens]|uniref:SpoIIIAH-like family protein n=1 Tax=Paenibacillus glufosinatiresistens TaxID=3070657 RepID=UPI00286E1C7C|nr:SpoIIIAH-like family protein [Paenibacillus sp. YX.27]